MPVMGVYLFLDNMMVCIEYITYKICDKLLLLYHDSTWCYFSFIHTNYPELIVVTYPIDNSSRCVLILVCLLSCTVILLHTIDTVIVFYIFGIVVLFGPEYYSILLAL